MFPQEPFFFKKFFICSGMQINSICCGQLTYLFYGCPFLTMSFYFSFNIIFIEDMKLNLSCSFPQSGFCWLPFQCQCVLLSPVFTINLDWVLIQYRFVLWGWGRQDYFLRSWVFIYIYIFIPWEICHSNTLNGPLFTTDTEF